jgi:hypothetical protein
MKYLSNQNIQSIEADKSLALQEALLNNVEKKANKYNLNKSILDDAEQEWRKTTNSKININSKLKNKTKEHKRKVKQTEDLLVEAQLELKN